MRNTDLIRYNKRLFHIKPPYWISLRVVLLVRHLKREQMLHVYHYLTNIINQTVLPLHKKAGGNHFLWLLPYHLLLVFI